MTNEAYIWQRLKKAGYTDEATAGIMGNLKHESGLRPDNLQGSYELKLGLTDKEYTDLVNSGAYSCKQFVNDRAGYGLAQWTYYSRKQALYNACFPDIASLEKQTDYLIKELSWYTKLQQILKTSGSIRECSDAVLHLYECPADQSERIELIRYNYAVEIYDRNSKKDPEPEAFYTWQLNAYKILENAYEFIKTVPAGFIAKKSNGYYVTCLGAFGTEKEALEHKDAAKRFNKKAFIISLTKEDILK